MLNHHDLRRERGVTLIELVITLAVLALLLFAVAPGMTSMMANARIRGAAESIQAGLQAARMEAMRRNVSVTFSMMTANASGALDNTCALSATGRSWVVSLDSAVSLCATEIHKTTAPRIVDKRAASEMTTAVNVQGIASGTTGASSVTFDSLGRISSGSLRQINLSSGAQDARRLRIEMTAGGVLRVCEPAATSANDPRRCLHS